MSRVIMVVSGSVVTIVSTDVLSIVVLSFLHEAALIARIAIVLSKKVRCFFILWEFKFIDSSLLY